MAAIDREGDLRNVALQNAQSIFAARRRAEDELHRQSEWTRITLASIGDGVISTDPTGRITFLNPVAEKLTGWLNAEAVGRPIQDIFQIINEWTRLPVENPGLRALKDGVVVGLANHTVLIAKDGSERPIDDSAAPIRYDDGSFAGVVLIFRDISLRKSAEEASARLAAIVESSDDAIISKSLEGIIRTWNSGARRLFGYTDAEVIGRPITVIIPPERRDEETEILARIGRGERVNHFETVRLTKKGRRIDISLSVSPIRDAAGIIVGASKIARDITERKRSEEALLEADRRKDQFIAILAHELRNPLAPLRNGLQVLRFAGSIPSEVHRTCDIMERNLGHMVRLIDDLLDISRISQNKMELRRAPVTLADVVNSAVETARPMIDAVGHELVVALPPEPVMLDADLTRLSEVFGNLLTNSAKYTDPGGCIRLIAERRGDEIIIRVEDNGIGIPPESLPRIFDMFSQVDRSMERSKGGLGIGLALVKGLVGMHGGTVTAASEGPGKGSTFTVTLRVLEAGEGDAKAEPADERPTRRRVLIVDDNRDAANSMGIMLKLRGNEVQTVYDGLAAVEAAEAYRPDVILMDVGMPRLNGYEATRRIRLQPGGASVIIIALTGWGQDGDRAQSKAAGCDGHLVKPVSLNDLERILGDLQLDRN